MGGDPSKQTASRWVKGQPRPPRRTAYAAELARAVSRNPKRANYAEGVRRRNEFVDLVARRDLTVDEMCQRVGVARGTYDRWRREYPEFAAQCDMVRIGRRSAVAPWDGSFIDYRRAFFGMTTWPVQARLIHSLDYAPAGSRVLVLIYPGSGKTTALEDYCCMRITSDPNVRIGYGSMTDDHPLKVATRLRRRMHDELSPSDSIMQWRHRFGPFFIPGQQRQGKVWSRDAFTVNRSDHDEREYTLSVGGLLSNVRGARWTDLYMDDPQDRHSLKRTGHLVDVFRDDWCSRVDPGGRIFVVTNRVGRRDFAGALMDDGFFTRVIEIPFFNPDGTHNGWGTRTPDWAEEQRTILTPAGFAAQFQQRPRISVSGVFTQDRLEAGRDELRDLRQAPAPPLEEDHRRLIGVDPSIEGKTSLAACAFDAHRFCLLDICWRDRLGSSEAIIAEIARMAEWLRPQTEVIEANAYQKSLVRDDRLVALANEMGFRVEPHETGSNKTDPSFGVAAMADDVAAGRLTYPWGTEAARAEMGYLEEEALSWEPHVRGVKLTQDRLMSVWFPWMRWVRLRQVFLPGRGPGTAGAWKKPGLTHLTPLPRAHRVPVPSRSRP